jgi:hypothetical protein
MVLIFTNILLVFYVYILVQNITHQIVILFSGGILNFHIVLKYNEQLTDFKYFKI